MKVNNYNISLPTAVINLTYWGGLIFLSIDMPNPFMIIGIGSLVYSFIYGFIQIFKD